MEVKPGYKQTEVGVIPEDWEIEAIGDVFDISGGLSASREQLSAKGHCYLHYGDIHKSTKNFIDVNVEFLDIPKLDVPLSRVSSKALLDDGDVVFVDASEDDEGTSKHIVVVNAEKIPYISGLHTIVAKSKTSSFDNRYKRYCFQTSDLRRQFYFYAVGTKVSGISKTNIKKVVIPRPPLPEQRAIAGMLSDVDALIGALDRLIAKKRDLKQAAMQQLLTGRTRLPGFSGEWEVIRVGDIFHVTRGQVLAMTKTTKECIGEYIYPVYSSQTKDYGLAGYYKDYLFENCITWTTDGANAGDVKLRSEKFYCTNVCGVLESENGYSNLCVTAILNSVSKKYVSYVGNPKLMNNVVADIRIKIPRHIEEQTAIAAVLSDMDAELTALEARRDKTRALKQGMMQELLTGETRLI
ncbi:MAG: restriction endonuclease subunit S [Syntrophales bacterium]|jgi:type I restriction enzyme S subunit